MMPGEPNSDSRGPGAGPARPLSDLLTEIAADASREHVSIAALLNALRDRALAALLLIFALPNVMPMPPGTSALLGAPLLFLATQLALGRRPWLPRVIAERSMPRSHFTSLIARSAPWLARAERLLRPRWVELCRPPAEYGVGLLCLLLALILFLPIPLGNSDGVGRQLQNVDRRNAIQLSQYVEGQRVRRAAVAQREV
jgi:hypothetical protein